MTAPFEQMMRWSYHWQPPSFGAARRHARCGQPRSPTSSGTCCWRCWAPSPPGASMIFAHGQSRAGATCGRARAGLHHHAAGDGADRAGQPDLDADRRLCGPAPAPDRASCSRWRSSWPPFPPTCCSRWSVSLIVSWNAQSRHLAVAADGAGHPMVHPVQRHRRRQHHAAGAARRRREFRRARLAVVEARSRCPRSFPSTSPAPSPRRAAPGTPPSWRKWPAGASHTLHAHGLGAYIADATTAGDFRRVVLGIAVMSFFVVVVNRLFWRPLYWYAERKYPADVRIDDGRTFWMSQQCAPHLSRAAAARNCWCWTTSISP